MERAFAAAPSPTNVKTRLSANASLRVAIGVGVAYYAGAQIGLALTFPPATTSVLWPPNAILTAALLLVPVSSWWVCLGAALPVHLALETGAGMSPLLVGLLFLTNCSEAIVAAGALRIASDAPARFNSLRRVAWFIGLAGLLAPVVSSFADSAVVTTLKGEAYWQVWRTRTFANMLTELSVVPAVILGLDALSRRQWPTVRRVLEGIGLVGGLVLVAALVFGDLGIMAALPGVPRTPTVLLLPLFFWAAVRFGVGGVSTALLLSAFVASVSTARGHHPFESLPPLESLMAVQVYLTVIGIPLMCLAGLLEERRRAAAELAERLRFEELLAQIAASFVRPVHASLSTAYDECLARAGEFLSADCVAMLMAAPDRRREERIRKWRRSGSDSEIAGSVTDLFPWTQARADAGDIIIFESLEALPVEASADRESFAALDVESAVVAPFVVRGTVHGALAVGNGTHRSWRESDIARIGLLAEVLSNASAREQAELEVLRARHELAQVGRLVSMGELASSLAHDLNQPLTGILCNAQAATRFLDDEEPSLTELKAIVADIIDDDRRAGDVIRKMRDMLARSDALPEMLDVNALVRDVAVLITSDTIIRNVSISFDFAPDPACVLGGRVELQQAVLNVLTNAMDAVARCKVANRLVHVQIITNQQRDVAIVVHDCGAGIEPGIESRIFDPFFTTKLSHMGMGLAVARSIVESQGGLISAANDPSGGAVVTIVLPGVERRVMS